MALVNPPADDTSSDTTETTTTDETTDATDDPAAAAAALQGELDEIVDAQPIVFAAGSTSVSPESAGALDQVATAINESTVALVVVAAHTDSVGGEQENLRLSQQRADAVVAGLVERVSTSPSSEPKVEARPS